MYNPYQYQMPSMNPYQGNPVNSIPFLYVNGIEGAKAYIVAPNQRVYLKDSDSNLLYEKSADPMGKYSIKVYEMKEIEQSPKADQSAATKTDLDNVISIFNEKIDNITSMIEKLSKSKKVSGSNE